MPKNKGLGGRKFRKGKKGKDKSAEDQKIRYANQDELYGMILSVAGDRRFRVSCTDGKERLCHVRGTMRKRQWVGADDIVLVSLRSFQDDKADIVHRYDAQHVGQLKKENKLGALNKLIETKIVDENSDDFIDERDEEVGVVDKI